jgi:hypothetical protein
MLMATEGVPRQLGRRWRRFRRRINARYREGWSAAVAPVLVALLLTATFILVAYTLMVR